MKRRLQPSFISWRFYFIILFILCVVAGLVTRIVDLTVIKRGFLQHQGDVRVDRVVTSHAFRGMILDRNGYPLAVSTPVYSIWMNPKEYENTAQTNRALTQALGLQAKSINTVLKSLQHTRKQFVYLKREVNPGMAAAVKKLAIPGIYLQEESKRYYPEGEVAAHVIGFTNIDDHGQEGLELAYNPMLTGRVGKTLVVKDRHGRSVDQLQTLQEQVPGKDVILSIDRRIQYLAYRALMEGIRANVADSGSVVVLDSVTGEVLAMVNLPSFNPNNRGKDRPEVFRNRAVTDTFEPGSTIKAFSIASALDSGLYKPTTIIDTNPGWLRVGKNLVRDEHNYKVLNVAQVLQVSSNVGTSKMVLSLPQQQLWQVLHRMGFGEVTGLGFPGEQSGSLVHRATWKPFALATLAFGYGVSVTPLQLAEAYSVFANNGMKKPVTLLKQSAVPEGKRVMDEATSKQMLSLLESVTSTKGASGELARVPGYRVAGKTGTAKMAGPHGYLKHHYISTFVGMAPASQPRLVIAVVIHNPQGKQYYAHFVAAPIFEKIMEGSLRVLNVAPDDVAELEKKAQDPHLPI